MASVTIDAHTSVVASQPVTGRRRELLDAAVRVVAGGGLRPVLGQETAIHPDTLATDRAGDPVVPEVPPGRQWGPSGGRVGAEPLLERGLCLAQLVSVHHSMMRGPNLPNKGSGVRPRVVR